MTHKNQYRTRDLTRIQCQCHGRNIDYLNCIYQEKRTREGIFYQSGRGEHQHKEEVLVCLLKEKMDSIENEESER
jgi:hypothetical protein